MTESQEFIAPDSETKPLGGGSMLVKIFSEPSAVYRSIKAKASWVIPIVVIVLVTIVSGYLTFPYQMKMQVQRLEQNQNISQDQLKAAREGMEKVQDSPIVAAISAVIVGVVFVIAVLIGAALYMLMGTAIFGGTARFAQLFAVSAWSMLPMMLGTIVKLPLILSKGSLDVRTSLALLMPGESLTNSLVSVVNSVTDIFTIWSLVLAIIGISIVYTFSKAKAAAVVLVPSAVLVLVGLGLSKMFGG